jgi:uncharacterized protein with GYD domain
MRTTTFNTLLWAISISMLVATVASSRALSNVMTLSVRFFGNEHVFLACRKVGDQAQRLCPSRSEIILVINTPEYVILSRLTADGRKTLKREPERLKEVNLEIDGMGARVVKQYALLGKYDFLTILEAPNNETVAKIMVDIGSRGSMDTTALVAMDIDEFLNSLK